MRIQEVKSNVGKVLVGSYQTKSGQTKNRYQSIPSHTVRTIKHIK